MYHGAHRGRENKYNNLRELMDFREIVQRLKGKQ